MKGKFWFDTCGDGVLLDSPQTLAWDDGNNNDYDGCSKYCRIEEGYIWTLEGDKSYWEKSWGNGIKSTTEGWDDGNRESGDGCDIYCNVETNFTWTTNPGEPSIWVPAWGDGTRDISLGEECDDFNTMDFDGWDRNCKLEFNYIWDPDPNTGIDECRSQYYPPIIYKSTIDSTTSTVSLLFNDTMKEHEFIEDEISCEFFGPFLEYDIKCNMFYSSSTILVIKYSVTPSIIGGVDEVLLIILNDIKALTSENQIPIPSPLDFKFRFDKVEPSAQAQSAGTGASYTFILTFLISMGVSILTGSSMELMWSFTNTLQIVFIFGLLNLHYPPSLKLAFSYMKYSNFDNPMTQYLSKFVMGSFRLVSESINSDFEEVGFGSTHILANSMDKIFAFMMLGLWVLFFYIAYTRCK